MYNLSDVNKKIFNPSVSTISDSQLIVLQLSSREAYETLRKNGALAVLVANYQNTVQ